MPDKQSTTEKSKEGSAAVSTEQQKAIAAQGGKAAHQKGVAHEWNKEEAQQAGKKGGTVSGYRRRNAFPNHSELV